MFGVQLASDGNEGGNELIYFGARRGGALAFLGCESILGQCAIDNKRISYIFQWQHVCRPRGYSEG